MRVAVHQPNLFPRLKVLQKIAQSDLWVILDDVQYVRQEWQNRARLRHLRAPAQEYWLTVPVRRPRGHPSLISEVTVCNYEATVRSFSKAIRNSYSRSWYWNWIESYVSATLSTSTTRLSSLCSQSLMQCLHLLQLDRPAICSSQLGVSGRATDKLVNICKSVDATVYLSGSGGSSYLDESAFEACGISVEWQRWEAPEGLTRDGDLPWRNISFLDFIARYGPDELARHLMTR
jgi:hypothetical protein